MIRRMLLKGMLAMTGDGLARPMNAPPGQQLTPGIQPGAPGIVNATRVIIAGPGGGLFIYSPTRATNNLIYSDVAVAGVDDPRLGNTVLAGATSYSNQGGTYYALNMSGSGFPPRITWFVSGTDQTGTYSVMYGFFDAVSAGVHGLQLNNAPFFEYGGTYVQPVIASDPAGANAGVAETWHAMSGFVNGWAATSTTPRYRLGVENRVWFDGVIDASAATGSTFFTIPAAYRPVSITKPWGGGANGGVIAGQSPFIQVTPGGACGALGLTLPTVGAHVTIAGSYPLD